MTQTRSAPAESPRKDAEGGWEKRIDTAIGAAAGAGIVFLIQVWRERRQRRERERQKLRAVQFGLARRLATLETLWHQWLAKAQRQHWSTLQMLSEVVLPAPLPLEEVEFLVQSDPNLLNELYHREELFQGFLARVDRYSHWREEATREYEKRTDRATEPEDVLSTDIEKLVGPRLHYRLKALSESFYVGCPRLQKELLTTYNKLNDHVKAEYRTGPVVLAFEKAGPG